MALKPSTREVERVIFLGRTSPSAYEAGEFDGRSYPAGHTLTLVVGLDGVEYAEVKVKGRDFPNVWPVLEKLDRNAVIEIEYESPRARGQLPELKGVRLAQAAAAAKN